MNVAAMLALFRGAGKRVEKGSAGDESGARLARRVVEEYGTADVFELAARAGVRILYERWPPLTVGECEPAAGVVRVNLATLERAWEGDECFSTQALARVIIAHELGHFFESRRARAGGRRLGGSGAKGEEAAHDFAAELLRLPRGLEGYERFWRGL